MTTKADKETMNTTILTDEQIENEFIEHGWSFGGKADMYIEVSRAIEQAVLQSPEVQAWKRDAERLKYLLNKVCMYQAASYGCKFEILNLPVHWGDCERDAIPPFLAAIDAAMEVKPC